MDFGLNYAGLKAGNLSYGCGTDMFYRHQSLKLSAGSKPQNVDKCRICVAQRYVTAMLPWVYVVHI